MAMKQCPDCGHSVSEKAYACPSCGRPTSSARFFASVAFGVFARLIILTALAVIAFLILDAVLGYYRH